MTEPSGWRRPIPPVFAPILIFLFFFCVIAAIQSRYAYEGMFGDDGGYVAPDTLEFSRHVLVPYAGLAHGRDGVSDTGHPLFFAWLVGVQWAAFGQSMFIAYLNLWFYGAWTLMATYLLTQRMARLCFGARAPRWTGFAAAVSLMCFPIFISHTQQYLTLLPDTALYVTIIWAWALERRKLLALLLCIFPLNRITGAFAVLGLGCFDLAYLHWALHERRFRAYAMRLAPYLLSAIALAAYLIVKLKVLHLPLSDYAAHKLQWITSADPGPKTSMEKLIFNARQSWDYMVRCMPCSIALCFYPIIAAALVWLFRRVTLRMPEPHSEARDAAPSPSPNPENGYWAIVGAWSISSVFGAAFYLFYGDQLLYSRFLTLQLLLIVLAIHGLIYCLGRGRHAALAIIAIWCLLQTARWHESWLKTLCGRHHRTAKRLTPTYWITTEDMHSRKAILAALADRMNLDPLKVQYLGGHFTMGMIALPSNGYLWHPIPWDSPTWLLSQKALGSTIERAGKSGTEMRLFVASFDWGDELKALKAILSQYPGFVADGKLTDDIGDTIEIYRLPSQGTSGGTR